MTLPMDKRARHAKDSGVVWTFRAFCFRCGLVLREDQERCPCDHPDPVLGRLKVVRP